MARTGRGAEKEEDPSGRKQPSQIKNKLKRAVETDKLRVEKKKSKKRRLRDRERAEKEAEALGEPPPPRPVPATIESTRVYDETTVVPGDEEIRAADSQDELASIYNRERPPKTLITSSARPTKIMYKLISELLGAIPGSQFYERRSYHIKQIVQYAINRDFTTVMVINENQKTPNALLLIALPDGPTAHFRLSSLVLGKKIKNHGRPSNHLPELILNNFSTQLGHRVGRLLGSLFPQDPQFKGRRVVTLHNQRDFIFFRHHRYIFRGEGLEPGSSAAEAEEEAPPSAEAKKGKKAKKGDKAKGSAAARPGDEDELGIDTRLQECGPRFTLKLLTLQKGVFDSKGGDYEWVHKRSLETSRRKFFL